MSDKHLEEARELAQTIEQIDGISDCIVDDWNPSKTEFSTFAGYEDGANLRSVSQLVRNELIRYDYFFTLFFNTPSQDPYQDCYEFEVAPT